MVGWLEVWKVFVESFQRNTIKISQLFFAAAAVAAISRARTQQNLI